MGVLQGFATKRPTKRYGVKDDSDSSPAAPTAAPQSVPVTAAPPKEESRTVTALKHLCCGGVAGSVAKTVTAPFSRLTILYQVHSMVTTKGHRPKFAMNLGEGFGKIVERGGVFSLWKGNGTSVIHRFPFSAINFYVYENMLDVINGIHRPHEDEDGHPAAEEITPTTKLTRFLAGATAGSVACTACYPLDLVRTRLTTELEGREHYRGIVDAFRKIYRSEGLPGFYSGIGPTLLVAVPNFAISLTVYGSLKEYALDDELFYNLRKIDAKSGEEKLGFYLTLMCGAASGCLSTLVTFPFDTIRRRMQIQNLHIDPEDRLTGRQQIETLIRNEGVKSVYRGLTPELIKVLPMVGTMFLVYEFMKDQLNVKKR
uniref:Mitochondrial carrier protein n=1 Tax=Odontella aurita TaxID=265563 RepID=A0A7S4N4U5_9STRA|mmetsp:Transcript_47761/g.144439  ORF Transcript_47761/g.144439 Transcript_47761/m.144439 type:complete len:371 (+) Transcript_47761:411-1523(+)|eukprot:CAMPEP_0113559098 /NCGR_PEP_ID=MMETSP0015_2-20120614/18708_1 /TAXON_ID=2838 /ORGANISM="Odontella" /LENGTH=370 /DNA_ID=CAMNT_0000460697 /DNA_START=372 /DNA_END=1484 /DNA_ORIENTATION=- /assembly_acc=CAM_ASM_000160